MADKTWEEALALYDAVVEAHPDFERKGKGMPYTSVNGHMFSMLRKDGVLGMRLSEEDREAFQKEYGTGDFENYGAKIREYVEVPDEVLKDKEKLAFHLDASYRYTLTLKPK